MTDMPPPHDENTEVEVLASVVDGRNNALDTMRYILPHPLTFYVRNHRIVALAIWDLCDRGSSVTASSIRDWLAETRLDAALETLYRMIQEVEAEAWRPGSIPQVHRTENPGGPDSCLAAIGGPCVLLDIAARYAGQTTLLSNCRRVRDLYARRRIAHRLRDYLYKLATAPLGAREPLVQLLSDLDRISQALDNGREPQPLVGLDDRLNAIRDGKIPLLSSPYPKLDRSTGWLAPGVLTVLAAPPKAGKSILLQTMLPHLVGLGVQFGLLNLEEDGAWILRRILAIASQQAGILSDVWVGMPEHREILDTIRNQHRDLLQAIEPCIADMRDPTVANILAWVRGQARRGRRVIIVDPVSGNNDARKPWDSARDLALGTKRIAEEFGITVILVNHTVKASAADKFATEHAGGAALTRFASTILTLRRLPEPELMTLRVAAGLTETVMVHRTLTCTSRNGPAHDLVIAMDLDQVTLQFKELGIVVADTATKSPSRRRPIPELTPAWSGRDAAAGDDLKEY